MSGILVPFGPMAWTATASFEEAEVLDQRLGEIRISEFRHEKFRNRWRRNAAGTPNPAPRLPLDLGAPISPDSP